MDVQQVQPVGIDGVTRSQLADAVGAVFEACRAIIEAVKEVGRIGDGVVYSAFMAKGYSLTHYTRVRNLACGTGLIRKSGHELVWVGADRPNPEAN